MSHYRNRIGQPYNARERSCLRYFAQHQALRDALLHGCRIGEPVHPCEVAILMAAWRHIRRDRMVSRRASQVKQDEL
jgi:hypothetical protein